MTDGQSRRRTLRSLGAIGVAIVAGCLGDDEGASDDGDGDDGIDDDGTTDDEPEDGEAQEEDETEDGGAQEEDETEDGEAQDGETEDGAAGDDGDDGADRTPDEIVVGPDGDYSYDPERLEIEPGTTVRWIWESNNHNVRPTSIPSDAEWEGHEPLENAGFEYEYAFQVEGLYEYVCDPHASAGMRGEIVVEE